MFAGGTQACMLPEWRVADSVIRVVEGGGVGREYPWLKGCLETVQPVELEVRWPPMPLLMWSKHTNNFVFVDQWSKESIRDTWHNPASCGNWAFVIRWKKWEKCTSVNAGDDLWSDSWYELVQEVSSILHLSEVKSRSQPRAVLFHFLSFFLNVDETF